MATFLAAKAILRLPHAVMENAHMPKGEQRSNKEKKKPKKDKPKSTAAEAPFAAKSPKDKPKG